MYRKTRKIKKALEERREDYEKEFKIAINDLTQLCKLLNVDSLPLYVAVKYLPTLPEWRYRSHGTC